MAAMTDPAVPTPPPQPDPPPDLGGRMEAFGQEVSARGEALGREAQEAADRWSKDPRVVSTANAAGRFWGLILLLVGVWFLAQVTFGYQLPLVPWGELWPIALILLGLLVIGRGLTQRR
jgi:hypothetical protein